MALSLLQWNISTGCRVGSNGPYPELWQSDNEEGIDFLAQDCGSSIANALELPQSCTKTLINPLYMYTTKVKSKGLIKYDMGVV